MRKKVDSAWVQCFWLRHLHSETNYLSVEVWVQSFWTLLKDCSPFFLLQHTTQVAVASIQPITPHHQNSTYLLPMQLLFTCPPLTHALPKYKYRPFFFPSSLWWSHENMFVPIYWWNTKASARMNPYRSSPPLSSFLKTLWSSAFVQSPLEQMRSCIPLWNPQQDLSQISLFSCH